MKLSKAFAYRLIQILIIVLWASSAYVLWNKHRSGGLTAFTPRLPEEVLQDDFEGDEWSGIYFKDKKIGYASSYFRRQDDHMLVTQRSYMRLKVLGEVREILTYTDARLNSDFSLNHFLFRLNSMGQETTIRGDAKADGIHYEVFGLGNSAQGTKGVVATSGPILVEAAIRPFLASKQLKVGSRFQVPVFDPMTRSSQSQLSIEVLSQEKFNYQGDAIDVFKLGKRLQGGSFDGMQSTSWVDHLGRTYKESTALGYEIRREMRYQALHKNWDNENPPDIIAATAVPANRALPDTMQLTRLGLQLKPRGENKILEPMQDRRQKKLSTTHYELMRDSLAGVEAVSLPLHADHLTEFLQATPFVQSSDERIRSRAQSIIGDQRNALNAARQLHDWVYKELEKTPVASIPSAVEVLQSMRGDCNEHTTLYTALARSVGLPARISVGLVYQKGYFYYHAWPEVYLGKWVAIDPTLNQFPADLTHIKFAQGDLDQQVGLISLVGNVDIEIVEVH